MSKNTWTLVVFILLFFILNVSTIKDGHNWGGDFSQYITHAKNIAEGENYSKSYDFYRAF